MEGTFVSGTSGILKKLVYAVYQEFDRDLDHDSFDQLKSLQETLEMMAAVACDAERKQENAVVKLGLIKLKKAAYDVDDVLDRFFYESIMRSMNIEKTSYFRYGTIFLLPDIIKNFDRISSEILEIELLPIIRTQTQKRLTLHYVGIENDKSNIASSPDFIQKQEKVSVISIEGNKLSDHSSELKLRYGNFSSNLKQCFSYFSLFPKDWKFDRESLIQMWMAEGFLDHPFNGGNQNTLEDIGNEYINNLLSFSLFQNVEYDDLGDIFTFKLHNSVHDFASSVVGRHEVTVLNSKYEKSLKSDEIRRLQLVLDEGRPVSTLLLDGTKLRTIFCNCNFGWCLDTLSPKLRVIHLAGVHYFTRPNDYLRHLRYLRLVDCQIKNVYIRNSYLLQTLSLSKCSNVHLFLKKVGSLDMLRHLTISYSDVQELPESIFSCPTSDMRYPRSVGSLRNLLSLDISHTPITKLPYAITSVYSLRKLKFHHCHKLKALPSNLGALTELRSIDLEGSGITELPDSVSLIYNLKRLNFRYCKNLKALPSNLGALTQLRSLNLEGSGITELPNSIRRINSLERLEFRDCSELKALPYDFVALTKLSSLNLEGTNITELPESLISNLWKFKSVNIRRLEGLVPYLVRKMEEKKNEPTRESSGIGELAGLNSLRVLEIRYLENVRGFVDAEKAELRNKQNLRELSLKWEEEGANTRSVEVLEGLRPHSNLEKLVIEYFGGVRLPRWCKEKLVYCLPNLVELYLSNCYRCEKLPALGMLPCLEVLWVYGMRSIKCLGQEFYYQEDDEEEQEEDKEIPIFPSLTRLELGDMDNLKEWVAPPPHYYVSFPVLETLCIVGCSELTSIPDFLSCTSLRELTIEDCDKLNKESPLEAYQSPNLITTNRYLVKEITSGTPEDSGIQDIAALETQKFLHLNNLENVRGGKEGAIRAKLKDKQHLEDLYLSWNSSFTDDDEYIDGSVNDEIVLEGLLPHPNLKMLTISGFRGLNLPKWMGLSHYLPSVVHLYFYGCNGCEQLPALGMLPCLRILKIEGMNSVQWLAEEFYYPQQESSSSSNNGEIKEEEINTDKQATTSSSSSSSGKSVFPSLVELSLIDMSILKEWAAPHLSFISFPSLERLIVSGCVRLKSIPFTSLSSLKSLELRNTNDEVVNLILANTGGERLTSLESVSIQYSPQLQFFPVVLFLPSETCIQSFEIEHYSTFQGFRIPDNEEFPVVLLPSDTHFQSLEISHCSNFQGFRILDEFQAIVSSDTGFNTSTSSLCSLKLFDCPALMSLPDLQEWTSLTKLWIEDCDKLKESFTYDLASLPSLQTLYVDRDIDLRQEYKEGVDQLSIIHLLQHQTTKFPPTEIPISKDYEQSRPREVNTVM